LELNLKYNFIIETLFGSILPLIASLFIPRFACASQRRCLAPPTVAVLGFFFLHHAVIISKNQMKTQCDLKTEIL